MRRILPGLLLLGMIAAPAFAQELYVVHGINGTDLGLARGLPMDVKVGDQCRLQDLRFGDIEGPIELETGKYRVEFRLAEGPAPCGGTLVLVDDFSFALGESAAVVAHLTPEAVITATRFRNDLRIAETESGFFGGIVTEGQARLVVRHAAAAPPLDVYAQQPPAAPSRAFTALRSEEQGMAVIPGKSTMLGLTVTGTRDLVLGPATRTLAPATDAIYYVVGSLEGGTLTLLTQNVPLR
ncbi:MAG: DUF4397 domain-containing protein [Acidobacteriota bacterium]|jgi:hypothetical protein